jgi:glycosyltransferase involved in cell wall biosynthesis
MKKRITMITEIIAPYRIPVFNALAQHEAVDLHVIFLSETDPSLRQWCVYKNEIKFSHQVLPSWRKTVGKYNVLLNWGSWSALDQCSPEVVICGGYNYLASWVTLLWTRWHQIPLLLWSESNSRDRRGGHAPVEFLKMRFLNQCTGFVVPGESSSAYLRSLGVPPVAITVAPNAVDVAFFAREAEAARQEEKNLRRRLQLPERFMLYVGRLIPEKGIFDLLEAYAKLDCDLRSALGLVFVGEGRSKAELLERAARISPGSVRCAGFIQRGELPAYYALAEALVFPTHTDPWGLVVNEAMSCGLPIVITRVAGCVEDLVEDGWNGYVVATEDVDNMSLAMESLAHNSDLRRQMGSSSSKRILGYSPQACAVGLARAALLSRTKPQ